MAESKVVQIIKKLDQKEVKLLDKFVKSPFFNQHTDVIRLFDYLQKTISEGGSALSNEQIFKVIFKDEKLDLQKLHYINSYLLKLIESFLAWQQWEEDNIEQQIFLLRAYRLHKLDDQFRRLYKKLEETLEKLPLRNNQYHNLRYKMQIEQLKFAREGRTGDLQLQELSDAQDIAYIAEKLYNACTLLSHQAVFKKEYDPGLLPNVLEHIENSGRIEEPAIALYYYAYLSLSNIEKVENFHQLKKLLQLHRDRFDASELRGLYLVATNFCIRRINRGEGSFFKEIFEIYKSGLDARVFLENGMLSRWTFNNIVVAAVKLKDFGWAEKFINEQIDKINPEHREGTHSFNLAYFYFEKGDYDKAMPLLTQMEHDDVLHNLFAKATLAKMYYKLAEFDSLDNLLQSFKIYIRRKKILGYHKDNYLNFIRYMQKLTQVNIFDKSAKAALSEQIQNEKMLAEREWLLESLKG